MKSSTVLGIVLAASLAGCGLTKEQQLERVAKDWCLTIRASQVIPVYPLTEDLQPGDVFLVRTRIEDQVEEYQSRGFLRMDNLVTRLFPDGYAAFYGNRTALGAITKPPNEWLTPPTDAPADANASKSHQFHAAPRAAFPSYSFEVNRAGGFSLALPIKGVPVGLAFLGGSRATGTVQISDAYTYGLDMLTLQNQVQKWAFKNFRYLAQYAPEKSKRPHHFLRVVNRVYLTAKVDVSLTDQSSRGGGIDAGAAPDLSVAKLAADNTTANFDELNKALDKAVPSGAAPGASLRLTAASGRSVSMVETFPRPLVVGYLAFDLPILADGQLGSAAPTQALLGGQQLAPTNPTPWGPDANTTRIAEWLEANPTETAKIRQWLNEQGLTDLGLTNVIEGAEFASVRVRMVDHFQIP